MVTSAADIVVKPIQAFSRTSGPQDAHGGPDKRSPSSLEMRRILDADIYGRPAALDVPGCPSPWAAAAAGDKQEEEEEASRAVKALRGSASGVGKFLNHWAKGMLLDMPLAVTEGMRSAPRLYGGEVYDPGPVTDWKTGGRAAGKNLAHGFAEGVGGVVTGPVRGAERDGALGAARGSGVGLLNFGAKMSSGLLGLVAYSGQGLYLSARAAVHRDTRRMVQDAMRAEGEYALTVGHGKGLDINRRVVLETFGRIVQGVDGAVNGERG